MRTLPRALWALSIFAVLAANAQTGAAPGGKLLGTFRGKIDAKANIFSAGHSTVNSGVAPVMFALPPGTDRVVLIKQATGKVSCCGAGGPFNDADGGLDYGKTNITSLNGIAGLIDDTRDMFLVGVFLDDTEPKDPSPERLNVTRNETQVAYAPGLRQVFFIGDGRIGHGTGDQQQIMVPEGAKRLFLGFADSYGFGGAPDAYNDNVGELAVTFEVRQIKPQFTVKTAQGQIGISMAEGVLFDTGKSELKPQAQAVLGQIKASVLDHHPAGKIEVQGHTDDVGGDALNQQLSQKRAEAVAGWLTAHGVAAERIKAVGYGKSRPKVPNTSAPNRAQNRRVEIVVQ
jgi:outer membrane protein OmpA-like peptidoglycan-associated protein